VPESIREQAQQLAPPYEDTPALQGFSIAVLGLDEANGGLVPTVTTTYYRGCKLYIKLRGLNRFTGFYIGAVSAQGSYGDGQMSEHSGTRYGAFFRTAAATASASAAASAAAAVSGHSSSASGSKGAQQQQHVSAAEALVLSKDRHVASAKDMCTDEVSAFIVTCVTVTHSQLSEVKLQEV
jgi:hypothetical protein